MVNRHVIVTPSFVMQMFPEIVLREVAQEPANRRATKVRRNGIVFLLLHSLRNLASLNFASAVRTGSDTRKSTLTAVS